MRDVALTFGIGLVSGTLSGAFGIGGGIITTPAIRLILGAPALVAVGTPLPVIIPSSLTGAYNYWRRGAADTRTALVCGLAGSLFAVAGAFATRFVGGAVVLVLTAAFVLYNAGSMIVAVLRAPKVRSAAAEEADAEPRVAEKPALARLFAVGAVTGLYSGFLGLGGGVILVPLLSRWLGFEIKRAIGTSLLAISILAIPGTITHALLGNIDWGIAALLVVGVIPGAWLGARVTLRARDRAVRIGFATMLLIVGVWLGLSELGGLSS
ncbi:MAG: sulfite exporter TauE/SafE family protein [Coriobacteriia bacterium]